MCLSHCGHGIFEVTGSLWLFLVELWVPLLSPRTCEIQDRSKVFLSGRNCSGNVVKFFGRKRGGFTEDRRMTWSLVFNFNFDLIERSKVHRRGYGGVKRNRWELQRGYRERYVAVPWGAGIEVMRHALPERGPAGAVFLRGRLGGAGGAAGPAGAADDVGGRGGLVALPRLRGGGILQRRSWWQLQHPGAQLRPGEFEPAVCASRVPPRFVSSLQSATGDGLYLPFAGTMIRFPPNLPSWTPISRHLGWGADALGHHLDLKEEVAHPGQASSSLPITYTTELAVAVDASLVWSIRSQRGCPSLPSFFASNNCLRQWMSLLCNLLCHGLLASRFSL